MNDYMSKFYQLYISMKLIEFAHIKTTNGLLFLGDFFLILLYRENQCDLKYTDFILLAIIFLLKKFSIISVYIAGGRHSAKTPNSSDFVHIHVVNDTDNFFKIE